MLNAWPNTEVLCPNSHQLLSSSTCRCLRCLSRRHQRSSTSRSSSCAQCSSHSGERPTCISPVLRLDDLLCHESTKHGRCGNLGATAAACCLAGRSQSCTRRALAKSEAGVRPHSSTTQPADRCAATTAACQHVGVGRQNLPANDNLASIISRSLLTKTQACVQRHQSNFSIARKIHRCQRHWGSCNPDAACMFHLSP